MRSGNYREYVDKFSPDFYTRISDVVYEEESDADEWRKPTKPEYSYNATTDKIVKDYTFDDGSYDWSIIEDEQGHEYGEWTVALEPTVNAEGREYRKCLRCEHREERSVEKLKNDDEELSGCFGTLDLTSIVMIVAIMLICGVFVKVKSRKSNRWKFAFMLSAERKLSAEKFFYNWKFEYACFASWKLKGENMRALRARYLRRGRNRYAAFQAVDICHKWQSIFAHKVRAKED